MPKVYKYLKKQFLDAMLEQGTILIGSLHNFRDAENVEIGDAGEGIITIEGMLPNYYGTNVSGDDIPDEIKPYFSAPGATGANIVIENNFVSNVKNYPDAYVYCTTMKPMQQVMEAFEAEVCVEISDLGKLVTSASDELYKLGVIFPGANFQPCNYSGRVVSRDGFENYWLKEPRHEWQCENRIIWQPKPFGAPAQPVLISSPEIAKLCSVYTF